jgi:hypothetical protein
MVSTGELVVKLSRKRAEELVEPGAGHRFDPGHGPLMKELVALRPADEAECGAYMEEARSFVAS